MPTAVPGRFFLAPMAELSHRALRELIYGFLTEENLPESPDFPVFLTEMISAPGLLAGGPLEKWYLDGGPDPSRLVYQLLGADEDHLVKAAALLDRQDCLGIDINMGCSAPLITKTGAGVRWMEAPDKAARLIERLRGVTKKQLSVKIRLGPKKQGSGPPGGRAPGGGAPDGAASGREAQDGEASGGVVPNGEVAGGGELQHLPYLLRFCRGLEAAGVDLITLHPRMADEKFKRRARWEYVYALRKELNIPVVGNGDIATVDELAQKADEGPVMAGRLLVREPWAFAAALARRQSGEQAALAQSAASSAHPATQHAKLEETGLRFLESLAQYQPPEFHLSRARRFFHYYCDNLTWAEHTRNNINRQETLAGIAQIWKECFRE